MGAFGLGGGAGRSRLLWPLWVCAPSPSPHPSLVPASSSGPSAVLLPGAGIGGFPAALARGAVAAEVSWSPEGLESPQRPARARRRLEKEQFTEKYSLSPFGDISAIKGLWVEAPKSRETPGSLLENAQVAGHSLGRNPRSAGRQFCGIERGRLQRVGFCAIVILLLVFHCSGGVWTLGEKKKLPCVCLMCKHFKLS